MKDNSVISSFFTKKKISGWGRQKFVTSKIIDVNNYVQIQEFIKNSNSLSCITRGLGRSYGDAAQLKDSYVFKQDFSDEIVFYENQVKVPACLKISDLLKILIPLGYLLPVSPGSANVTIGGAIAADVHGKNHHKDGSFGNHVAKITIINGYGDLQELQPNLDNSTKINNLFWATIGGMGLTGIILDATINLIKIETSYMKVNTFICDDLTSLMNMMISKDKEYLYSVAWIDSLHKKGRGVITCGEHALKNDLPSNIENPLFYDSFNLVTAPNFLPNGILNKFTVKVFNEIWFQKSKALAKNLQTIPQFFYPLDGVNNWNRIYGSKGFYQYQFVIPDDKTYFIYKTLEKLKKCSANSFLTVLKRFGSSNNAFLSFPQPGWTLSVDLPASNRKLIKVLEELDNELATLGGKIYLAKDLRQSANIFKKTYQFYPQWRSIKSEMDPKNIFQSDLSIRLGI